MKHNLLKTIFLLLVIVIISGCQNNLQRIEYNEFEKMIKNKDNFILIVSQDGCSHCEEYSPKIKKILKENNITAFNLNITYISKNNYSLFKDQYEFEGTPTTMFFKKGIENKDNRLTGNVKETKIKKVLKKEGYIK